MFPLLIVSWECMHFILLKACFCQWWLSINGDVLVLNEVGNEWDVMVLVGWLLEE